MTSLSSIHCATPFHLLAAACERRALPAQVRVLEFRPEGQGLRRLNRVGHGSLHRLAVDRFRRGGSVPPPLTVTYITIYFVYSQ